MGALAMFELSGIECRQHELYHCFPALASFGELQTP
jgi:hypothetical protein